MASSANDSALDNKKRSELCHEITYTITYHSNASNPFYRFLKFLFLTELSLSSCRRIIDHDDTMAQPVPKRRAANGPNETDKLSKKYQKPNIHGFKKSDSTSATRPGSNQGKLTKMKNEIEFPNSISHIQKRQPAKSSSYYHQIHGSGAHDTEINVLKSSNFKEVHSEIVVDTPVHSTIVVDAQSVITNPNTPIESTSNRNFPSKSSDRIEINAVKTGLEETMLQSRAYGNFNQYPPGILNPAFSGMLLCELKEDNLIDEFQVNKFHQIKNGIILHYTKAYVFTSIRNDDIQSHLKILLRRKEMKDNITPARGATILRKYVRHHSQKSIIPCIKSIQASLHDILGITESSFIEDRIGYCTLLYRIYLLLFMLRYKMPVQRCRPPGERNSAKTIHEMKKKGWYTSLKPLEQKILESPNIELSSFLIPEDTINGIFWKRNINFSKISITDIQNTTMYRDGTMDNMKFQYMIMKFQSKYVTTKISPTIPRSTFREATEMENIKMKEVATIQALKQEVASFKGSINAVDHKLSSTNTKDWNEMFHNIISTCNLERHFTLESLPPSYAKGFTCSHIFHVDMEKIMSNTIHLTILEQTKSQENPVRNSTVAKSFISNVINHNPVWDLGLQFLTMQTNIDRIYTNMKNSAKNFTKHCICPCSYMLKNWHKMNLMDQLPNFKECSTGIFIEPLDFVHHLQTVKECFYHRIVMRIVQNLYSSLLAKFTTTENKNPSKTFFAVHSGTISLPSYQSTGAEYSIFEITK